MNQWTTHVTSHAEVWIETTIDVNKPVDNAVTSHVEVWIETFCLNRQ